MSSEHFNPTHVTPVHLPDPLRRFPIFRTSDPEEFMNALLTRFGASRAELKPPVGFMARGNLVQLQSIGLAYGTGSADASVDYPEADRFRLWTPLTGKGEATVNGKAIQLDAHQSCIVSPGQYMRLAAEAGHGWLNLRIDPGVFEQKLACILGARPSGRLEFATNVNRDHPQVQNLWRLIRFFAEQLDAASDRLPSLVLRELETGHHSGLSVRQPACVQPPVGSGNRGPRAGPCEPDRGIHRSALGSGDHDRQTGGGDRRECAGGLQGVPAKPRLLPDGFCKNGPAQARPFDAFRAGPGYIRHSGRLCLRLRKSRALRKRLSRCIRRATFRDARPGHAQGVPVLTWHRACGQRDLCAVLVLKAMPTGRANARPMTGSASSADARAALLTMRDDSPSSSSCRQVRPS